MSTALRPRGVADRNEGFGGAAAAAPATGNKEKTAACVVDGVAHAICFGAFNAEDSTDMLQAALSSNASTVFIGKSPSGHPWLVRPLFATSCNQRVVLEAGVRILAKRNAFHGLDDSLLMIDGVNNVTIEGNGAVLQMRR